MSKLNNKFGYCCNCPSLSNDDRLLNNYISSRIYNDTLKRSLNILDSHEYRKILQNNGLNLMKENVNNVEKIKCKNHNKNKFYYDFSKYTFNNTLENEYIGPYNLLIPRENYAIV
jgi:hypothetical protein